MLFGICVCYVGENPFEILYRFRGNGTRTILFGRPFRAHLNCLAYPGLKPGLFCLATLWQRGSAGTQHASDEPELVSTFCF